MSLQEKQQVAFDMPKNNSNYIKIIGVGGGGSNAVNNMFRENIVGVDYIVCNTDIQALEASPVPNRIRLGAQKYGAGAKPECGEQAAKDSTEGIIKVLDSNTEMLFITAGLGGGTGTGAAPEIAKIAKEKDLLTVAIVTMPFEYEGVQRKKNAMEGLRKLMGEVDAFLVINNDKINELYGELPVKEAYKRADSILTRAAKGLAEVITKNYDVNIDLEDVRTVLKNSGPSIIGTASSVGDNRAIEAVAGALNSPLLNDNKITGAKKVLFLVTYSPSKPATTSEVKYISDYIRQEAGEVSADVIYGLGEDETLEPDSISVMVIATGFPTEQQKEILGQSNSMIHVLDDDNTITCDFEERRGAIMNPNPASIAPPVQSAAVLQQYPIPSVPIKKEPSLADTFNTWVDCELITSSDETFVVFDKDNSFPNPTPTQRVVQVQPAMPQQEKTTVHQLRDSYSNNNTYGISNAHSAPTPIVNEKGEKIFPLKIDDTYQILEKTTFEAKSSSFTENKSNAFTGVGMQPDNRNGQMIMNFDSQEPEEELNTYSKPEKVRAKFNNLQSYNYNFPNIGTPQISRLSISQDGEGQTLIRPNNSYLHDNVD